MAGSGAEKNVTGGWVCRQSADSLVMVLSVLIGVYFTDKLGEVLSVAIKKARPGKAGLLSTNKVTLYSCNVLCFQTFWAFPDFKSNPVTLIQ